MWLASLVHPLHEEIPLKVPMEKLCCPLKPPPGSQDASPLSKVVHGTKRTNPSHQISCYLQLRHTDVKLQHSRPLIGQLEQILLS